MSQDIAAFLEHARAKGMDPATIRMVLLSSGWKEKDVAQAFAENVLDLPVPAPPDAGSAREAFFHLLTFAAFYAAAVAVTLLLFQCIDHWLPDPAERESIGAVAGMEWQRSRMRWQLAVLIIAFPIFLLLSRFLLQEMRAHPERAWSGVRRWLTYLTLFVASVTLGCDGISILYKLLDGTLTGRFVLKALVVLVVAGLPLSYYIASLQVPTGSSRGARLNRAFGIAATVLVAVSMVLGFVVAGSPGTARLAKLDARRIEDLQGIVREIELVVSGDERFRPLEERKLLRPLPGSLEELVAQARNARPQIHDPRTGEPYGYEVLDSNRYRLCATFDTARDESQAVAWNHPAGRACFERDALRPD